MEDGAKLGGVEATRVSTRAVDKERIHDQRRRASQVVDSMPKKQRRSSTMALGPLEALPKTRSGKTLRGIIQSVADGVPYTLPGTIEDASAVDKVKEALRSIEYPKGG